MAAFAGGLSLCSESVRGVSSCNPSGRESTMIKIRRSEERGHADYGWLNTRYTFSFNDYYDPAYSCFRSLRVINDDRVQPGRGFGSHPHRDMEILTRVLEAEM